MGRSAVAATTISPVAPNSLHVESISVVVPVLNEISRLGRCLDSLICAGREVREILVVDGGSTDGTQNLVTSYLRRDARIRVINAAPIPSNWNGKAWGLDVGLRSAHADSMWIATIDADVQVRPGLFGALLAHAQRSAIDALSIAARQELCDIESSMLHPSMLSTLVYRFGLPGQAATRVSDVQANGQCFFARHSLLLEVDVFSKARVSVCEDVTAARALVRSGHAVGFYEAGDLVITRMYENWRETWCNWPRSLTVFDDVASRWATCIGIAEVVFVQALPPLLMIALMLRGQKANPIDRTARTLNLALTAVRAGVLIGTRRAYCNSAWTYWLSMIADIPVAAALIVSALRKHHTWRGRALVISER